MSEYTAVAVTNPHTHDVSAELVPEADPADVVAKHIQALNTGDWPGLMAQHPDSIEMHLPGGTVVRGREAVGNLYAAFTLPRAQRGMGGLTFTEQSRCEVGNTIIVNWRATADFLAEPYYGSDAYVCDDGLMVAIVGTMDGSKLVFKTTE
ncbi:MAG: nuclear transport factor 2 family protein [Chloroflexaceae bacterium]|nr:nuclear transport factor 2 family protein [Chloroflexaceae bacterium]NJL34211.1 nuclear transport factor 2 family protein [Chloroflexaceae bacterium]NJO07074.1 nuclear transport factor 2 family protein [Chloroflexaceae bacterium]